MKVERVMWVVKSKEGNYVCKNGDETDFIGAKLHDTVDEARIAMLTTDKPVRVRVTIEEL